MPRKIPSYKIQRDEPVVLPPTPVHNPVTPSKEALSNIPVHKITDGGRVITPSDRIMTTMEIRSQIANIMNSRNYHPIRELVEMVQAKTDDGKYLYDAEFRKSIHMELAPYIAPKLKAQELTVAGSGGVTFKITVQKFVDKGDNPELHARKVKAEPIMEAKVV